jgi:mevalonate kinase
LKSSAEAPCKAIISGEHFVVHGAWALAAALGKKVKVDVETSDKFQLRSDRPSITRAALLPAERVVETMAREFSFRPSLRVDISSEVPEGAGLGSSAATMVALVSALSRLKSLGLGRREVVEFAMVGEREIHGHPSGIDVNICALGGVLLFKMGAKPKQVRLSRQAKLLIVYSGRKRRTKRLIDRVASTKARYPALFAGLTESASELSRTAAARLAEGDLDGLGRLLSFNHAVLSFIGASNPRLDELVDILLSLGCRGAKLTGAGGGGSVVAVAREGKEKRTISELKRRGFDAFEASVPVGGARSWLRQ